MSREFIMSIIGELTFFLDFQIKKMTKGTFISQEKYNKDLLKFFNMNECKPIKTHMPFKGHLDLDEGGKSIDQTLYRSMIGILLYFTASRHDIMFSMFICARFKQALRRHNWLSLNAHQALTYGIQMSLFSTCGLFQFRLCRLQS